MNSPKAWAQFTETYPDFCVVDHTKLVRALVQGADAPLSVVGIQQLAEDMGAPLTYQQVKRTLHMLLKEALVEKSEARIQSGSCATHCGQRCGLSTAHMWSWVEQ